LIEIDGLQVNLALKELVSRSLVIESEGADKQILYQINRNSFRDVRAFLEQSSEEDSSDVRPKPYK